MTTTSSAFSWHHLNEWNFGVLPTLLLVGALTLYGLGVARTPDWPRTRLWWFFGGIVTTFLATQSVIGVYDMSYFSIHMIQHLALIMVAAPFFALSAPLDLARSAGPAVAARVLDSRAAQIVFHPLVGYAVYFVLIPLTHLTGLANTMMTHPWIHHVEQIAFLVSGYLFFRVAFGREAGFHLHPGLRLVYVMAAVPVDTFTGLAIVMSNHQPIPSYAQMAPTGTSAAWQLGNVHLGGAIMWIGGDALMLLACIPIVLIWVRWETLRTRELDAELDALGL
jgi:putative copper resistance protein D